MILHEQLIQLSERDFESSSTSVQQSSGIVSRGNVTTHTLATTHDKQPCGKARYRVCKVCSILHRDDEKKIHKTRTYCVECSSDIAPLFLCDRIRSTYQGNQLTCFQIWHQLWKNGTRLDDAGEKIRRRALIHPERANSDISQDFAF